RLELEQKIQEAHAQYERAKSMAQLTKQGHVYIISNIGSFGEDVFKIGMTRRLEPMDRVKELSGASVPFDFDVHAMISCDDAPALEKTLHDSLEKYRINRINLRKEFFRVKLEKIINEVERHHGQMEYVADPAALQYLQSLEYAENEAA
nr:GIY-YIG nuclease family protein [Escherichia coli]